MLARRELQRGGSFFVLATAGVLPLRDAPILIGLLWPFRPGHAGMRKTGGRGVGLQRHDSAQFERSAVLG